MPDLKPAGKPDEPIIQPVVEPVVVPETKAEPKVYAGKYKSPEDLEAAYSGLEKKLGEQGNKMGALEKDKEFLMSQIEKAKVAPVPGTDFNAQLAEIQQLVEEGELSAGEGIVKAAQISSQIASAATLRAVGEQQQQNTVEGSRAAFSKEHADFFELQQSGALEDVKNRYPGLHDDFSAYWQVKSDMQTQAIEAVKMESFEAGKKEMQNIASGDNRTDKVLQNTGTQAKEIGRKEGPYTKTDLRNSGLAALQKARSG